jgi:hypothetical protein
VVGAENLNGTGGDKLGSRHPAHAGLRVTSTAPTPGQSVSYTVTVQGSMKGIGTVQTSMTAPIVPGATIVTSKVTVT